MSSATKLNPRNFPRPPLCEKTPRHLQVKLGDQVIADTKDAYWVLETHHPPTYYLPPSSLQVPLKQTDRSSYCEWKGMATYYQLENPAKPGEVVKDRLWSYDNPTSGFKGLTGYLSFYAGPWDCYVDGERVVPQPGDFYGGWMTSDIEREAVKGGPGTLGWSQTRQHAAPKERAISDVSHGTEDHEDGSKAIKKFTKLRRTTKTKKADIPLEDLLDKLPGELRNGIYKMVLVTSTGQDRILVRSRAMAHGPRIRSALLADPPPKRRYKCHELALLAVSQKVRKEASSIYYGRNYFVLTASISDFGKVYDWVTSKTDGEGGWPFDYVLSEGEFLLDTKFKVFTTKHQTHTVAPMLSLAKLVCFYKDQPGSHNSWNHDVKHLKTALSEVIRLALKAKMRGVPYTWLEEDFHEWAMARLAASQPYGRPVVHNGWSASTYPRGPKIRAAVEDVQYTVRQLPWTPMQKDYPGIAPFFQDIRGGG